MNLFHHLLFCFYLSIILLIHLKLYIKHNLFPFQFFYLYNIVDTGQNSFYSNNSVITEPDENEKFYGQDATYQGNQPSYTDNSDGTITDLVTGLIWQKNMDEKITFNEAIEKATNSNLAGYDDWRVPTIINLFILLF